MYLSFTLFLLLRVLLEKPSQNKVKKEKVFIEKDTQILTIKMSENYPLIFSTHKFFLLYW